LLVCEISMMEDCAHGMSASHGCTDDKVVVESFKEALKQRIGEERYRMWFSDQVGFDFQVTRTPGVPADSSEPLDSAVGIEPTRNEISAARFVLAVRGEFAQQRLSRNFMSELRGAAMQAVGVAAEVVVQVAQQPARQAELPLEEPLLAEATSPEPLASHHDQVGSRPSSQRTVADRINDSAAPSRHPTRRRQAPRGRSSSLGSLITREVIDGSARPAKAAPKFESRRSSEGRVGKASASHQPSLPHCEVDATKQTAGAIATTTEATSGGDAVKTAEPPMTLTSFVAGDSNRLAHTAAMMVVQTPGAASPLFLAGPTGVGKTHLLSAIADCLRRRHRMRRVVHTSAETFTNEFIAAIRDSTLTSFRRRYRDVDALLIDDVQFLGKKTATLREMLYTVDDLAKAGRPMIFSGSQSPSDTSGLTSELAGRMSSGLVCSIQPMDAVVRGTLLQRTVQQRCEFPWPPEVFEEINAVIAGDGRTISGIVNLVATLQRMFGRMPVMDEIRQFGGELLRSATPIVNLSAIERAVCETFHLEVGQLQTSVQTRNISEPRMLAMYLSRQLTSSAFAEIAKHFGGRSHSTAIMASKRVQQWLAAGKTVGRGPTAISTKEALDRIEHLLRAS